MGDRDHDRATLQPTAPADAERIRGALGRWHFHYDRHVAPGEILLGREGMGALAAFVAGEVAAETARCAALADSWAEGHERSAREKADDAVASSCSHEGAALLLRALARALRADAAPEAP